MNKVNISSLFFKNAAWNALDAFGTQTLVVLHHILLHIYAGAEMHGIIGSTFSTLYMAVLILNGGFDFSCAPFISYYATSKETFHYFFRTKLIPQVLWIISVAFIGVITLSYSKSIPYALAICGAFIGESFKKSLKTILQLLFLIKTTTIIECVGMIMYMGVYWVWFWKHGPGIISPFGTLAVISGIQSICFGSILFFVYQKKKAVVAHQKPPQLNTRVAVSRLWVTLQRIIEQLFSNNFLVPFFAFSCGIQYASYFKIMSSIARWVSLFGDKAFGTTSLMLLTAFPLMRQNIVSFINRLVLLTIIGICPIIIGISNYIGHYYCSTTSYTAIILCSSLIVLKFFDMACVVYERFLVTEEKAYYTLAFSFFIAVFVIGMFFISREPLFVILLLIFTRGIQAVVYQLFIRYTNRAYR